MFVSISKVLITDRKKETGKNYESLSEYLWTSWEIVCDGVFLEILKYRCQQRKREKRRSTLTERRKRPRISREASNAESTCRRSAPQETRSFLWIRLIARTVSFPRGRADSLTRSTEMINDKRTSPSDFPWSGWRRSNERRNKSRTWTKWTGPCNYPVASTDFQLPTNRNILIIDLPLIRAHCVFYNGRILPRELKIRRHEGRLFRVDITNFEVQVLWQTLSINSSSKYYPFPSPTR